MFSYKITFVKNTNFSGGWIRNKVFIWNYITWN